MLSETYPDAEIAAMVSDCPALTTPLAFTVFTDRRALGMKAERASLIDLAKRLAETPAASKEAQPHFKLGRFDKTKKTEKGCFRSNAAHLAVTGIEADYDAGTVTPDQAAEMLARAKVAALIVTSASHQQPGKGNRWRVVCPLSVEAMPDQRAPLVARVNGVFGGMLGPESFVAAQSFGFGHVVGRPVPEVRLIEGRFLDLCGDLDAGAIVKPAKAVLGEPVPAVDQSDDPAAVADAQERLEAAAERVATWVEGDRNSALNRAAFEMGGLVACATLDRANVIEALTAAADACGYIHEHCGGDESEAVRVIEAGLREGMKHPTPFEGLADMLDDLPDEDDAGESRIDRMNARHGFTYVGSSGVVADFTGDQIEFRSVAAFKEMHSNKKVNGKKLGTWWMEHPKRRSFDRGVVFDPSGRAPAEALNLWRGFAVAPDPHADCGLILDFVRDVVAAGDPDHAAYIFTWLADLVQHPARKPGVALVLRGLKGVGKDTLAEIMRRIIGKHHVALVTATARIADRFNAQFATALLAHFEEATWGGNLGGKGTLQSLITSPQMPLEKKGVDVVQVDSFVRLILTANDEWVVPATSDERRYAVFEVPDTRKDDTAYWDSLYRQIGNDGLAGFLAYLLAWQVPEGVDVRRPPQTAGLARQKVAGLRNVERWWFGLLSIGELQDCELDDLEGDGAGDWEDGCQTVGKTALRQQYEEWIRRERFQGETMHPAAFTKELKRLCPGIKSVRPRKGSRARVYQVPDLSVCRGWFAHALKVDPATLPWSQEDA